MSDPIQENGSGDSHHPTHNPISPSAASVPPLRLVRQDTNAGDSSDESADESAASTVPLTQWPIVAPAGSSEPPAVRWQRIPAALRERAQWMLAAPDSKGKLKIPSVPDGIGHKYADATDPANWTTFDSVCAHALHLGCGIGYCLQPDDPFTCIDLDVKNERNEPKASKHTKPAQLYLFQRMVNGFASYTEASGGGEGAHIWCKAKVPPPGTGFKRDGVEVYSQTRFIACTGAVILDLPIEARQEYITNMAAQMKGNVSLTKAAEDEPERHPDAVLWERMKEAANADKMLKLFAGNWEGDYPSQSEADAAMFGIICWWTPNNAQAKRMFRDTELGKRKKAKREDYLDSTLFIVRSRQAREEADLALVRIDLFGPKPAGTNITFTPPAMDLDMMLAELVYVVDGEYVAFTSNPSHRGKLKEIRTLLISNKTKWMVQDSKGNQKEQQKPTFDCWLDHEKRKTAFTFTFDPAQARLCLSLKGLKAVNLWVEPVHDVPPDWQEQKMPFVDHLAHLIKDEEQRHRFTQFLAHMIQRPGELPSFGYVMIAEQTGMGRGLVGKVMKEVLPGYVGLDNKLTQLLTDKFTDELSQRLFLTVPEINEGRKGTLYKLSEELKSFLDASVRNMNPKTMRKYEEKNCARLFICSNHMTALPIDKNDRRLFVIDSSGELPSTEHLRRVGALLKDQAQIASVWEYLRTYPLDGFDPYARAPMSETKKKLIENTKDPVVESAEEMRDSCQFEIVSSEYFAGELYGLNWGRQELEGLREIAEKAGIVKWTGNGRGKVRPAGKNGKQTNAWILKRPEFWTTANVSVVTATLKAQLGFGQGNG